MANYYLDDDGKLITDPKKKKGKHYIMQPDGTFMLEEEEEIAPVKKDEGKLDFFQKGAFDDGYQFGDITKSILGTAGDAGVGVVKGAAGMVEGVKDLGQYGVAGIADLFGADEYAEEMKKKAQKNSVQDAFKGVDDYLDQYSLLGRTSDAAMQGLGQVGTLMLTGGLGSVAGWGVKGATALTTGTMGLSSMGSGMSDAYNDGATDGEAFTYGLSKGVIDAGTELLFGGLGKAVGAVGLSKGISSLDDTFAKALSSKLSNQVAKNLVEFGVKASGEGVEELLAGLGTAVAKKLTYMDEEELKDIIADENLLEQFVVGTVTSGMIQSGYIPGTANGSLKDANAKGTDFITGYTQNEQAVIDKLVEEQVAEQETDGKKLTKKEIGEIEKQVKSSLERGEIEIDKIESVLGGDTFTAYDTLLKESQEYEELYNTKNSDLSKKQEDRLAELTEKNKNTPYEAELSNLREKLSQEVRTKAENDTFLLESYNEKGKKSKTFEADLTKYDEKQQEIVKKAMDSGILNDTRKTHDFVDMLAKLSSEKGVSFDFMNNEKLKESGFAIEGKTINGFVKDGNIALNINSNKALNTVVGHEITHVLEGTDLYNELQTVITEYAKTKGDYDSRLEAITRLYEGVENVNIDNELTADLVGDYLFTDSDFINSLSTSKPNVFKKIYNEIKYLLKLATAGSKEARQLEKVKKAFDKAFKETAKNTDIAKYDIKKDVDGNLFVDVTEDILDSDTGESTARIIQKVIAEKFNNLIDANGQQIQINKTTNDEFRRSNSANALKESPTQAYNDKLRTIANADEILTVAKDWIGEEIKHIRKDDIVEFARGNVTYRVGENGYVADVIVATRKNGSAVLYDIVNIYDKKIAEAPVTMASDNNSQRRQDAPAGSNVADSTQNVNIKYSVSEDTEGRTLSNEQKEYFKDSKVVDENGNLIVVHHGTYKADFTEFKRNHTYFTDSPEMADSYAPTGEKFSGYLNIKTPFVVDAQGAKWSGIPIDTELKTLLENYGSSVFKEKGKWRSTPADIVAAIEEAVDEGTFDYDGVIIKNVDDTGNHHKGKDNIIANDYIAFNSNQFKNLDNKTPTDNPDIRFSLSEDSNGKKLSDEQKEYFKGSKVVDENGKLAVAYHGSSAEFTVFDKNRVGKGIDQFGAGFYFGTTDEISKAYGENQYEVYLNIQNPIKVYRTSDGGDLYDVEITKKQAYEIAKRHPMIYDAEESPLGDFVPEYWEQGPKDWMIKELANSYTSIGLLDGDLFRDYPNELHEAIRDVIGYDGVEVSFDNTDSKFYIAWFDNQMKQTTNTKPTASNDIRYSMSMHEQDIAPVGKYNVYGKDIALETVSEMENVAPVVQEKTDLVQEVVQDTDEFAPMTEAEANERDAMQGDRLYSLNESDMPEDIAPIYDEELGEVEAASPFDDKDIQEVGDRKQKAYMYENPEVKPYFQEEAMVMLGELRNSVKGERVVNADLVYESGGEFGVWGTKRETSEQIAYMLDRFKYSYADIEKGLNAIIEDHGAENNAISKRLEFMIDERLREGYTDFLSGMEIPSNQDYINLLRDKQINSYSDEAYAQYLESLADHFRDTTKMIEDIAPTQAYEAIEPRPQTTSEKEAEWANNKMKKATTPLDGPKERKFIGSAIESEVVDGKVQREDLDQRLTIYNPISNKKTLGNANAMLDNFGYEKAVGYFESKLMDKKVSLDDIALGERLIQEAIKNGDYTTAGELIQDVAILGTELGQKVQALSIIQRLTPEGQLKMLQKTVNRGKAKMDKAFEGVEITQEMIDHILSVYGKDGKFDQKELDEAVEDVKKKIADQMTVTKMDKVNAWRYLSMLGNPKTHIRNLVSNVAMKGTLKFKNAIARTVEDVFLPKQTLPDVTEAPQPKPSARTVIPNGTKVKALDRDNIGVVKSYDAASGKYAVHFVSPNGHEATVKLDASKIKPLVPIKDNSRKKNVSQNDDIAPIRTKTWRKVTNEVKAFVDETAIEMKDVISDDSKYSEEASLKAKRDIFKNKILQSVYEFNSDLLSKEDWWFSKPAFKNALGEFLTANGIRTKEDIAKNKELVEKAKQYAVEQSQIATFRQYSWLANKIREIENKNTATDIAVGSILPFKKTPINIAKAGLSYSPLGFTKTLTYDIAKVKKGEMEASEAIDHLAQNVTGTALTVIGYMLAMSGTLNGGGDDDKEGKYDYQLGKQAYSLSIGGATYSLSWLSPVAMPLFVGANAYEQLVEGKEWNADVVMETLAQTLDPLSEMSFLSSLDSVLSSYDSGMQKFAGIGETMLQSYATQFIPTLSSQIATVMDDKKRTTKVAGDSGNKIIEGTINKIIYKIPGLRETLEPSTDIWGNDIMQTENIVERAIETFIAPYSKKGDISTEVDSELKSLYAETGDNGLLPNVPYNYVNYQNEKYKMSAEEYTDFKKTYGQTSYDLLEELFATTTYRNATTEDRTEMVNKVYDYARDEAKKEYLAKEGVDYTNSTSDGIPIYKENHVKGAIDNDMTLEEFDSFVKNPEKYSVSSVFGGYDRYASLSSQLKDIEGEKDEDGNTINGSKKENTINYINELDLDYGEKIILFKSQYPKDKTYNEDIVEYLNSRTDISFEEEMEILKGLGFTVESDGTDSW